MFAQCNEAVAHEFVPPARWKRVSCSAALCCGAKIFSNTPSVENRSIATSCAAVPLYGVALPFMLLIGKAQFMKYAIKFCDHAGRLLTLVGLNLMSERKM